MRLLSAAAIAVAATSALPRPAAAAAPAYARDSAWLCLPGRADVCSRPLATAALLPNGFGPVTRTGPAKDPPLDCFYVYPTVSLDEGLNSDLVMNEETFAAAAQAAPFAPACRVFAPKYRQMTAGAVLAYSAGQDVLSAAGLAYGDVAAAWRDYLANRSQGRPFVLIGHSQGSLHLIQLIAREIERKPEVARRMRLAILPGYNLLVPQGKLVGGDLKATPLCSRRRETGCVIAWTSFRENNLPPVGAMFGYSEKPGMTVACVNPARPGATGWVGLDSLWPARTGYAVPGGPVTWSAAGSPPAPWLSATGLNSGRCVNAGRRGYFAVRTHSDPRDKRTDRVGGEVGAAGLFIPGWGMHLADMSLAQGDLVRLVGEVGGSPGLTPRLPAR